MASACISPPDGTLTKLSFTTFHLRTKSSNFIVTTIKKSLTKAIWCEQEVGTDWRLLTVVKCLHVQNERIWDFGRKPGYNGLS